MRLKATLSLEDGLPQIELDNGMLIEHDRIGYIAERYTGWSTDYNLEPISQAEINFIIENDIDIEVEVVDEFSNPELYEGVGWGDGEVMPKLHKNKIIIHYK